ncbi:MAG: hypothetical protein RIS29_1729 [Bacteroidota bacterium]|jgi:hypothetical protein
MNFEEIDSLLKRQIGNKPDLKTGLNEINQLLKEYDLPTVVVDIDRVRSYFTNWVLTTLRQNPAPQNIIAFYFGLVTLSGNNNGKIASYLAGSTISPEEDEEWACETNYFPKNNYFILSEFVTIEESKNDKITITGEYEVLVYVGLTSLLIQDTIKENRIKLLESQHKVLGLFTISKQREKLYMGVGFDSGDLYLVDKISR